MINIDLMNLSQLNKEDSIIDFLGFFYNKEGNFEFVLSNNSKIVSKVLFWSKKNNNKYVLSYIICKFPSLDKYKLQNILKLVNDNLHIWIDSNNSRLKIYIWMYNKNFKLALTQINLIKKILKIDNKYFLEYDFCKFDCIGIDITSGWYDLKVYEIVNTDLSLLNDNINKNNIKEVWYLKNFFWRKKKFFRFKDRENIGKFKRDFDLSSVDYLNYKIKDFYNLQKIVKYYCVEWNNKEIYFI